MIRTLLLAVCPLLVAAETPGLHLNAPVLGYIFDDKAGAIRQVSGVPGAANLEQPVDLGAALSAAWVHSSSKVAAVVTKDGPANSIVAGVPAKTICTTGYDATAL